jgi:putative transposase
MGTAATSIAYDLLYPKAIRVDQGSEFVSRDLNLWAYHHATRIDFSRPGKPTDNAFIETFNGSLRDECLNIHWFETIAEAQRLIEAWRIEYNESRPHMALGNKSTVEYLLLASSSPQPKSKAAAGN